MGLLLADLRVDKVWTQAFRSSRVDAELVSRQIAHVRAAAEQELRAEGYSGAPEARFAISMRYAGQNYEHEVPVPSAMTDDALRDALVSFERIHAERYGYAIAGEEIELVAFHVTVSGRRPSPRLVARAAAAEDVASQRVVSFRGHGALPTAVFRRYALPIDTHVQGPCIVEEEGSTTLVEPAMSVRVLGDGQLLIETGIG
jgi:N-methylhydantoinase A